MTKVRTVESTEIQVRLNMYQSLLVHRFADKLYIVPCAEQSGANGSYADSKDSVHSHSDHTEVELGTVDILPSRKSSSSTDSCISAHSRSGSESAGGGVMHGYSLK